VHDIGEIKTNYLVAEYLLIKVPEQHFDIAAAADVLRAVVSHNVVIEQSRVGLGVSYTVCLTECGLAVED
jgi:ubiquinone/menaquinone biosynthesis C-methylase UbiE